MEPSPAGRPAFTVIGGPNGAGKSTMTLALARQGYELGQIVNPDVIAAALPGPDTTRDARAGRETLHRTRALIGGRRTFSRETTLSSSEILRTIRTAKEAGFRVNLFFVGVDSLRTSEARVRNRVALGGHDIPAEVQARRFCRTFANAARAARLADVTYFMDSGERRFSCVGIAHEGVMVWDRRPAAPQWLNRVRRQLERGAAGGRVRPPDFLRDLGHGR